MKNPNASRHIHCQLRSKLHFLECHSPVHIFWSDVNPFVGGKIQVYNSGEHRLSNFVWHYCMINQFRNKTSKKTIFWFQILLYILRKGFSLTLSTPWKSTNELSSSLNLSIISMLPASTEDTLKRNNNNKKKIIRISNR